MLDVNAFDKLRIGLATADDLGFNIGARPDAAAKEDQKAEEPEYQ